MDQTREHSGARGALAGRRVDSYEVRQLIGEGGMGEVYLARHTSLDRQVALKVLAGRFSSNPEWLERFRREAKILAQLDHPNAVRVYDYGQADGQEYLVMEYIEGKDLDEVLKDRGRMRTADALAIAKRVCNALAAAHELGIIHRDIKPANILITREKVKVADFGLSRALTGDGHTTQPGRILGTPNYMSPEQCRGEEVDARSDLYSVGASLYHMLAGRTPYTAEMPLAVLRMHIDEKVQPAPLRELVPDVPEAVEELVRRLMAKDPAQRYAGAREASAAIDELLRAMRSGVQPALQRPRKPVVPWLLYGTVAAAVAAGLFLAVWLNRRGAEPGAQPAPPKLPGKPPVVERKEPPPPTEQLAASLQALREQTLKSPADLAAVLRGIEQIERRFGKQAPAEELARIGAVARESALRARAEAYSAHIVAGEWAKAVDYLDPGVRRGKGREQLVKLLKGIASVTGAFGWKLERIYVKRVDATRDDGWVDIEVHSRHRRKGSTEEKRRERWLLIDRVWYAVPSKPRGG